MTPDRLIHYTLGHPELDRQHVEMFRLMDSIITLLRGSRYAEADTYLDELYTYTLTHNVFEYQLMTESDFPFKENHTDHNKGVIKAMQKLKDHIGREFVTHYEIVEFEDALSNHIDFSDRQIVEHMKANGMI